MKLTLDTERLKEKREAMGWNKSDAAYEMGIAQNSYVRYENGDRTPTYSVIKNMAITLGTSVDYLTGKSNNDARAEMLVTCNDKKLEYIIESYYDLPEDKKKRLYTYTRKLMNLKKD
ncbi:MAG: helix-turn-helix domain-containing protein [Lachnospiraceae bacterium]|nr:helix-turn-helix domain-containing protein [Lachnospiraceae bacterium]